MFGTTCRLQSLEGDDLGLVHAPHPIEPGDLLATVEREFRVESVVLSTPGSAVAVDAFARVQQVHCASSRPDLAS
jgi:hypothetical protein